MRHDALTRWTVENSAELYGIRDWGSGYFDISSRGEVIVRPNGARSSTSLSLVSLLDVVRRKKLNMPVLVRFSNVLSSRIQEINEAFHKAMRECNYQGAYRGVYPIKVNQQREVVEDITLAGQRYHHGLEAGSKTELIAALSVLKDPEAFVICNGYKDEEFIDLALHATRMGIQTVIVVEMPGELDLIVQRCKRMRIRPRLGIRVKLSSRAGGHWDSSGGDRSKFGLDASQIIGITDSLRKHNMLDCLRMLHYHLGSQISDIRKIRSAIQEACRFYVEMVREGAPMGIINIGGGLAVDYDGSHTNFSCSANYSTYEYADDVVEIVMTTANEVGIPHPVIVSESGRATVAHHSVLIFNILQVRRFEPQSIPSAPGIRSNELIENLLHVCDTLSSRNVQEAYHDAMYYRDELRTLFLHGNISLRERAAAETIFWHVICRTAEFIKGRKYVPDELEDLDGAIADVYYGNFSVFQSLPDFWAVDQLFPIMPIHRLHQKPTRMGVISDITCDSDGKLDRFIDLHDVKSVLPLHEPGDDEYYLGVFLVGAYQETIGDMHNLFGNTNVLHISIGDDGEIEYARKTCGDSTEEILRYMEYNPKEMTDEMALRLKQAAKAKLISPSARRSMLSAYRKGIRGYTYFEK